MKSREPRQMVIIPAQMRGDTAWSEVCIRNVSSHGMMLEMSRPPAPGSYVELRRASVVVVARVMWSESDRCGLRTQAKVDLSALSGTPAASAPQEQLAKDRSRGRFDPLATAANRAAMIGRSMQFVCGAVFGALLVSLLSLVAYQALSRPLSTIAGVLH
jgi:hypothetical protein